MYIHKIINNLSIYGFLIFAIVCQILAWYCDTFSTLVTYELLTRKRGVVHGGGGDDVGGRPIRGQTVKNLKVGPWGTLTAAIMAAIWTAAVGGPLK